MALTLEAEQRLATVGLTDLFTAHQQDWTAAAKRTYNFIVEGFPNGATIRRDDVAKALSPILEVDEILRNFLAGHKLRQKFWIQYFTDLIIDNVWNEIHED